jgi:hypothetical protein
LLWLSPARWFLVLSPTGLTTIFYFLTALGAFRPPLVQSSQLLLAPASTVALGIGPRRDPWLHFCSFQTFGCFESGPPLRGEKWSDYCWSLHSSEEWLLALTLIHSLKSKLKSKSKLCCDRQSVGQSVLVSSPIWAPRPHFCCCQTVESLLMWDTLSDERLGLSLTTAVNPCQRSNSRFRVPRDSWPYFTVSDSRLPQLGGPGPCIYIFQEQGGPVMSPGTGFPFRRLLQLAAFEPASTTTACSQNPSLYSLCMDRIGNNASLLLRVYALPRWRLYSAVALQQQSLLTPLFWLSQPSYYNIIKCSLRNNI